MDAMLRITAADLDLDSCVKTIVGVTAAALNAEHVSVFYLSPSNRQYVADSRLLSLPYLLISY